MDGAVRFLTLLGGSPDAAFTFQTFDDNKKRRDRKLARVLHGTFDKQKDTLSRLNADGAGIFVTINETDGKGREEKNIVAVRALFVDLDGEPLEPATSWALMPHAVVESSPGKWHVYWLVNDCPLESFRDLQQKLIARFKADPVCHDLPRVLRVPGFLHQKDAPFESRLYSWGEFLPYSVAQIQEALDDEPVAEVSDPASGIDMEADAGAGVVDDPGDLPPVTPELVASALAAVSAEDYDTWLRICFALRTAVSQGKLTDAQGRDLYHNWSKTSEKYDARATDQKWETKARDRVTLGTLFKLAADRGWVWRAARSETVRAKIAARTDEKPDWPSADDDDIDRLNKKHFVVVEQGKTLVVNEEFDDVLDRGFLTRSSFDDFRNRYMNIEVQVGTAKGRPVFEALGKYWLRHPGRRQYDRVVFLPGKTVSRDVYNLWRGWSVAPAPGSWGRLKEHIHANICNGVDSHFQFLISWLARGVQAPHEPGRSAVVLRGPRGTGKSTFVAAYGALFGQHYLHLVSNRQLTGHFNSHLRDAVVVFADEAVWGGAKQEESVLKGLVTEDTLVIEGKGRDALTTRNCVHLLIATNNEWAVPAGPDERRFAVFDVSDKRQRDNVYFEAIKKELDEGGRAAMLHELLTMDIRKFDPYDPPSTSALLEQKLQSFDPFMSYFFSILYNGTLPGAGEWGDPVSCQAVYTDYINRSEKSHQRGHLGSDTSFGMRINKLFRDAPDFRRRQFLREIEVVGEGGRVSHLKKNINHYIFPPLPRARQLFERAIKQKVDWPVSDSPQKQGEIGYNT